MNLNQSLLLTFVVCLFTACSTSIKIDPETKTRPNSLAQLSKAKESYLKPTSLTHEAATLRSKQIGHISYVLWFGLDASNTEFEGRTVIHFELKPKAREADEKLVLDFEQGSLQSVNLNGLNLTDLSDPERFDGHHIYIKLSELGTINSNRIEIAYIHPYSSDGNGLHRFKDPADGKVYLYSHFEPYSAHRMFPCFDQPDIKATYELTVQAPKDWEVISNTLPREVSSVDGRKSWAFPPSPLLSTYIFALHAGPYSVWTGDANGIPMRLFARKSLASYVDAREWLKVTQQGLDFFGVQFGFPYPFAKYDQVIVPDFNSGAMENAGAVTFSENFVSRTRMTQDQKQNRANVILHEMAHMWFGDLVTMRWWNGLWLNESFATFMAAFALEQATEFKNSWQTFFAGTKQWAYWEDQLVTTHPIESTVPNTDQAKAIFDGIVYGKGASTLKQLNYYLGSEDFREGLQRYFQRYAYRNTNLGDFFKMLSEASGKDLNPWQHLWLQTSGVNTVETRWACETDPETQESKLSKFEILQSPAEKLRPHRTQIALFSRLKTNRHKTTSFMPQDVLNVTYSDALTRVDEAIGKPCPDFIFPNYKDNDYVKVVPDSISLQKIMADFESISDPFMRQMIWHQLWEMVIDGKLRAQDYIDFALKNAAREKDTVVLSKILRSLVNRSSNWISALKLLSGDLRDHYRLRIESYTRTHLTMAPAGSDLQMIWFKSFLDAAFSTQTLQYAKSLLESKNTLRGMKIDQERRWELIQLLSLNGYEKSQDLIEAELKQDQTDTGQKASIAALAMNPDPESKKNWLQQISQFQLASNYSSGPMGANESSVRSNPQSELSFPKIRAAMVNFQILGQENLIKDSVDRYFQVLPKFAMDPRIETEEYSRWFASNMYPSLCSAEIVQRTNDILNAYPNLPASIIKRLKTEKQKEEICIQARKKSEEKY